MIIQLLDKRHIPEDVKTLMLRLNTDETTMSDEEDLSDLFLLVAGSCKEIYFVVDGLDECDKHVWQKVLAFLERLARLQVPSVRLFVPCVEEDAVAHYLHNCPSIQVSAAILADDIESYIIAAVRSKIQLRLLKLRNPDLEGEIVAELVSKAKGM